MDQVLAVQNQDLACNVVIQNQKQAYNLINDLCSVMRVMPFYSAGTISITQDRPTDPSYLFNLSNVTEQRLFL